MLRKDQAASQRDKKVNFTNEEPDFWSEEVDDLIKLYTMPVIGLNWNKLEYWELLSPTEHNWLAYLMKPMKVNITCLQCSIVRMLMIGISLSIFSFSVMFFFSLPPYPFRIALCFIVYCCTSALLLHCSGIVLRNVFIDI